MTNAMPAALAETADRWAPPFTTISGEGPFLPLKSLPVARRAGLRFYRWAESGARRDGVSRPSVSGGPSRPFTRLDGELYGETRRLGDECCESRARARSYMRNGRDRLPIPGSLRGGRRGLKTSGSWPESDLFTLDRSHAIPFQYPAPTPELALSSPKREVSL